MLKTGPAVSMQPTLYLCSLETLFYQRTHSLSDKNDGVQDWKIYLIAIDIQANPHIKESSRRPHS